MTPTLFFDKFAPIAVDDSLYSNIPPSIKLAQAALESGWGDDSIAKVANNYFGIKAHGWDGPVYNATTHEFYNGSTTATYIKDDFRRYGSAYASFMDHSTFLNKYDRYKPLFTLNRLDYKAWANGLQSAGYATSPTYANKLIGIIEKYNLQQYDIAAEKRRDLKNLATALFLVMFGIMAFTIFKIVSK